MLKEGLNGKASIQARAKGLVLPAMPLAQAPVVTVQLSNLDGVCWDADFSARRR